MPVTSGLTAFGIIRKRMAELLLDFNNRIKDGGAFGALTTLDDPDSYPGDPLVQIASTAAASAHELWEATENWYNQLNPSTATGNYLEWFHGERIGIARGTAQSDEAYRAVILDAIRNRATRTDPVTVATARPDVLCATVVRSTVASPVDGIPTGHIAIVVRGCDIDYAALAADFYQYVELGMFDYYGDVEIAHAPEGGGCVRYKFLEAKPLFVAVELRGYFTQECGTTDSDAVLATALARLKARYDLCGLGVGLNAALAMLAIGEIEGFVLTDVLFGRRARMLWANDCDAADAPRVTVCGEDVVWATSISCGTAAGETWCAPALRCLDVRAWESIEFDAQFMTLVEDATAGGCA